MIKYQQILYALSKYKKTIKEGLKVSKSKIDSSLNGYLIYQSHNGKSLRNKSIVLALATLYQGIRYFSNDGITSTNDLIILGIVAGTLFINQRRLMNSIKSIVVDKKGENIKIQVYNMFAYGSGTIECPIYIARGCRKPTFLRPACIKIGGNYGYKQFELFYRKSEIVEEQAFEAVARGESIKFVV